MLQILAIGQERNHAADSMAHHPRIESLVKLGKESEATWLQIGKFGFERELEGLERSKVLMVWCSSLQARRQSLSETSTALSPRTNPPFATTRTR